MSFECVGCRAERQTGRCHRQSWPWPVPSAPLGRSRLQHWAVLLLGVVLGLALRPVGGDFPTAQDGCPTEFRTKSGSTVRFSGAAVPGYRGRLYTYDDVQVSR